MKRQTDCAIDSPTDGSSATPVYANWHKSQQKKKRMYVQVRSGRRPLPFSWMWWVRSCSFSAKVDVMCLIFKNFARLMIFHYLLESEAHILYIKRKRASWCHWLKYLINRVLWLVRLIFLKSVFDQTAVTLYVCVPAMLLLSLATQLYQHFPWNVICSWVMRDFP